VRGRAGLCNVRGGEDLRDIFAPDAAEALWSVTRTVAPLYNRGMSSPADAKYTQTHEWHRLSGDTVTLGITKFAVNELTDVTYVQMKPAGTKVSAGQPVGEVESVKATSDIYSAVGGEIVEVNKALSDDPSLVNTDPYGKGWLVKLKVSDAAALGGLMDAKAYDAKYPA
jgi:glycine cleavage system H protein